MVHIAAIILVCVAVLWMFEALAELLTFALFVYFVLYWLPVEFISALGH